MTDQQEEFLPFETIRGRTLDVDVLLPRQVAERCQARGWGGTERSVERWITKPKNNLPAVKATPEQARELGYHGNIGGNGVFFVRLEDVDLVPTVRHYPIGTTRRKRKQQVKLGK